MLFLIEHPLPEGLTREGFEELEKSIKVANDVILYRSFMNFSQCRGYCLMNAPSRQRLLAWLKENNLQADRIIEVEAELELNRWVELPHEIGAGV